MPCPDIRCSSHQPSSLVSNMLDTALARLSHSPVSFPRPLTSSDVNLAAEGMDPGATVYQIPVRYIFLGRSSLGSWSPHLMPHHYQSLPLGPEQRDTGCGALRAQATRRQLRHQITVERTEVIRRESRGGRDKGRQRGGPARREERQICEVRLARSYE